MCVILSIVEVMSLVIAFCFIDNLRYVVSLIGLLFNGAIHGLTHWVALFVVIFLTVQFVFQLVISISCLKKEEIK